MKTEALPKKRRTKTILIIEDDADIQTFASRVLELEGYHVLKAGDGETGMEIIRANPVALLLLDLRLPGRDGWSILQEIRNNTEFCKIPVIVISAVAESTQRRRTLRMGAASYLVKPMSAHSLAKTIAGILRQRGRPLATLKNDRTLSPGCVRKLPMRLG